MELEGKWVRAFGGVAAQSVLIPQMNAAEITFLPMRPKCLENKDGTIFLKYHKNTGIAMETLKPMNVGHIVETIRHECRYIAGDGFVAPHPQCQPLLENTSLRPFQFYIRLPNGRLGTDEASLNPARLCNVGCNSS